MTDTGILNLKLEECCAIDLTGMGNMGYSWVFSVNKENIASVTHQYIVPPDPKPGDRGIERFTVRGNNHGSCIIEFRQIQSWATDQPPLSVKKYQVNVGM
jgi:hypothetical protein